MAQPITEKQQSFIKKLSVATGAYQDGEGMVLGMKIYKRMDIDAALAGNYSSYRASKLIDTLLGYAKENNIELNPKTPAEKKNPEDESATYSQVTFIQSIAKELGKDVSIDGLSKASASKLINTLLAEKNKKERQERLEQRSVPGSISKRQAELILKLIHEGRHHEGGFYSGPIHWDEIVKLSSVEASTYIDSLLNRY